MLPIQDQPEERRQHFPIVMISLVVLNVLVFLYELLLPGPQLDAFFTTYGVVPYNITGPGHSWTAYLTLLTSQFIHGGFLHIAGNMLFLWIFGDNVESEFGHVTFLLFYLFGGVMAGLTQVAVMPTSTDPSIGASGAIAAVLAAYLLLFPRARVRAILLVPPFFAIGAVTAFVLIGIWIVLQVFQGLEPLALSSSAQASGVAYFAHIGGFFTGLALTAIIRGARGQPLGRFEGAIWTGWVFRNWAITVIIVAIAVGLASLIGGVVGILVQAAVVAVAAIFGLFDGYLRVTGHTSILGQGHGLGRLLGFVQIIAAAGVILAILFGA